jgi:hypothetical protein
VRVRLAILQFPLLYCVGVLVGLSVYGFDLGSVTGYLYLIPLLVGPAVLPRLRPGTLSWLRRRSHVMAAMGVLLGAVAYRPLHLGFWDERSVVQAGAISAFGLVSAVVGWLAVTQVADRPGHTPAPLAGAIVVVALFFFLSRWYPLIPILGAALCLAPVVTVQWKEEAAVARGAHRGPFLGTLAFYLAAEVSQVVWDGGIDSSWGPQLSLAFLTAAAVAMVWWIAGRRISDGTLGHPWFAAGAGAAALLIAGAASVATACRPAFVLSPIRQLLLGFAIGGLIVAVLGRMSRAAGGIAPGQNVWLWFTIGLAVSNLYSAQLEAYPVGRLAFALPAIGAFAWERTRPERVQPREPAIRA